MAATCTGTSPSASALSGVHRAETEIVAQWIKRAGPLVASRA